MIINIGDTVEISLPDGSRDTAIILAKNVYLNGHVYPFLVSCSCYKHGYLKNINSLPKLGRIDSHSCLFVEKSSIHKVIKIIKVEDDKENEE